MAKIKTKFDSLVKLKKVKIDEIENEISKANQNIFKEKQELEKLQNELNNFQYPKQGTFSLITQFKMMEKALLNQLNQKQQQINFLENQRDIIVKKLKEANLDYEKMRYLQGEEIKKYIKQLKEKEAKDMDEIALMLYKG